MCRFIKKTFFDREHKKVLLNFTLIMHGLEKVFTLSKEVLNPLISERKCVSLSREKSGEMVVKY